MEERPTNYKFIDRRTGERVSLASAGPLYLAMITLGGWKVRDRKGKRPDVHERVPHIAIAIEDGK